MAHSKRKPRKGSPAKVQHGKEKKQLRVRLDREREERREDPYRSRQEAIAAEFGCDPDDLGECMRCSSSWPSGMKLCPECGWDGVDLAFMMPMPMPTMWS